MEYIEKEAAFNAILKLIPKVDDDGYCWVIRGDAAKAIDFVPAADVRPVVLCKDCLSYDKANRLCTLFFHEMYEDDFCSRRAPRL